jgi:teichuronic acid biosynthesis glycosyltransferase TuaG
MPKVTVVIPFFNCRYVDQAIESVLNQTYRDVEIIVVDDGSTMHQERIIPYMDRIHYIGKSNGGTASALNYGIQSGTGTYVAWLSSDDMFYPSKIERQVAFMEQHYASISYTDYHNINEYSQITQHCVSFPFVSSRAFVEAFALTCPVNGCTVMMRKEFVQNMGYFDERLAYTQDYEFWLRTLLNRVDFHYINEPLTAYRRHEQMGSNRNTGAILAEFESVRQGYFSQLRALLNTI